MRGAPSTLPGSRPEIPLAYLAMHSPCCKSEPSAERPRASSTSLATAESESVTMPDEEGQDMWGRWLAFLRQAVDHGGIVVH
ncbi:MAG: hypothetical protein QOK40_1024 [Miltoncostaeaceae bacterium]|nr:hypothetical protein [Miltoncostaeaceae bacterium]